MRVAWSAALLGACLLPSAAVAHSPAAPPSGPSSCSAAKVRAALVSFAGAFDRGDDEALESIFAQEPDFQWYATGSRAGAEAKRRETLIPYLRARHRLGERLRLVDFGFNGNSRHYGSFEMTLRRSVPDVSHGAWVRMPGKGAAVCREGSTRLIVISFGPPAHRY